jgi:hypothetical protein
VPVLLLCSVESVCVFKQNYTVSGGHEVGLTHFNIKNTLLVGVVLLSGG